MLKQDRKNFSEGFAQLEMVLVMAIIVIFTGLLLVNYRQSQKEVVLEAGAAKLAQNLKRVQEMALFSRSFRGKVPSGGYGAVFQSKQDGYIIFADCNHNFSYDNSLVCGQPPNFPEKVEEIKIDPVLIISAVSPAPYLSVVFTPPDPKTNFWPRASQVAVVLALVDNPNRTKTVVINKAGLIEIK